MFLAQGNTTNGVASHSSINTAGSTGAMRVKFLAQGNNSKRQCLGIKPGSPGSQADPKPLMPLLPLNHLTKIHTHSCKYSDCCCNALQLLKLLVAATLQLLKLHLAAHTYSAHCCNTLQLVKIASTVQLTSKFTN